MPRSSTSNNHCQGYPCGYQGCPITSRRKDIRRHEHSHRPRAQRPFKCEFKPGCPFRSNERSGLNTHIKSVHLRQREFCQMADCGKSFSDKSGLSRHMKGVHEMPKKKRDDPPWKASMHSFSASAIPDRIGYAAATISPLDQSSTCVTGRMYRMGPEVAFSLSSPFTIPPSPTPSPPLPYHPNWQHQSSSSASSSTSSTPSLYSLPDENQNTGMDLSGFQMGEIPDVATPQDDFQWQPWTNDTFFGPPNNDIQVPGPHALPGFDFSYGTNEESWPLHTHGLNFSYSAPGATSTIYYPRFSLFDDF